MISLIVLSHRFIFKCTFCFICYLLCNDEHTFLVLYKVLNIVKEVYDEIVSGNNIGLNFQTSYLQFFVNPEKQS